MSAAQNADALAIEAVAYVLNRSQRDPDLGWYISSGTEAFERLCAAEAAHLGEAVEVTRDRRSKDLQPEYRKRRPEICERRDRVHQLEAFLEERGIEAPAPEEAES